MLTRTTDGHVFRLPKRVLLDMGEIIPDTSASTDVASSKSSTAKQLPSKPVLDENTVYLQDLEQTSYVLQLLRRVFAHIILNIPLGNRSQVFVR